MSFYKVLLRSFNLMWYFAMLGYYDYKVVYGSFNTILCINFKMYSDTIELFI